MKAEELYDLCVQLAEAEPSVWANRLMHETLVLCCAEGTKTLGQGFGNLFAQVDFLCKRCRVPQPDRRAVQAMRRYSNRQEVAERPDWLYHVRALALFVSAVMNADVPGRLVRLIPTESRPAEAAPKINARYIRCIVTHCESDTLLADTGETTLTVDCTDCKDILKMAREGMQLNLLDCHLERDGRVIPGLVVVEPDFLLNISSIARCFKESGSHSLLYTVDRLSTTQTTQPLLLGNFAGSALDDVINRRDFSFGDTLCASFREQALQFCACENFNATQFKEDAENQMNNIAEAVGVLNDYLGEALLEPSFVCEQLGLSGRVDLMTADMRLLVEQKSGKNYAIERGASSGILQKEDHYVQLLLYYGILRYNFGRTDNQVDIRLLYSRYPASQGLLYVNYYQQLFRTAIRLRNQIVATELLIAREGFGRILPCLNSEKIFRDFTKDGFFYNYVEPQVTALQSQLAALTALERAYYERMLTFVYREQLLQKVGRQEGQDGVAADLWNVPLSAKREAGNIYTGLRITDRERSAGQHGYDLITLSVPSQGELFLPNFRRGDMVYLYAYEGEPDVRRAILYKGTMLDISVSQLTIRLNDGQQNAEAMRGELWAVEHADSDLNATSAIRGLHQFITAAPPRRALLLGQREPEADTARQLSRSWHPHYDEMLLKACQARDYFLLVGPPGTGKTSMALRFLVNEEPGQLLLMAYTNRAVDEICAMLDADGQDYLRIGHEASCDERFRAHLLDAALAGTGRLDDVRQRLQQVRIVVGTTSMLQSRPQVLALKHFALAIVDEASQILEPNLVGLLANDRIDRFILIGDHKQLPAVVQQTKQESLVDSPLLQAVALTDCRRSLFERLLEWERRQGRTQFVATLRRQGRMHPAVAEFPNRMFYYSEDLVPVPCDHQRDASLHYDLPAADALDRLLQQRRVMFFDCAPAAGAGADTHPDKANPAEARLVADLLRRIHRFHGDCFDVQRTVGVIVPYRNQIAMIRHELEQLGIPELLQVSIDTVERYQGSQRDVIIYSFTVSRAYQLDFLTSNCFVENGRTIDRKLNVAMTRARKQLLMAGNAAVLRQNAVFAELIDDYEVEL